MARPLSHGACYTGTMMAKNAHATKTAAWHQLSVDEALARLKTSVAGLTTAEANRRQTRWGKNVLPTPPQKPAWTLWWSQFQSPVVAILAAAMAVTAVLRNWVDFGVIGVVLLMNASIGFWQERRATVAFERLRQLVTFHARTLRDGAQVSLPTAELVSGDVVLLRAGMRVPADARLMASENLHVVEAALTGESVPSAKNPAVLPAGTLLADRENMLYFGTVVASGTATAAVCQTGVSTELGQIARLSQTTAPPPTPLQRQLRQLSRQLTLITITVAAFIIAVGLLHGQPLIATAQNSEGSVLYLALAIAVSAIPEGMLVLVTVMLALGMQEIAKHGALVRRLSAAEVLGSTSIICTDKTGTLTEGRMQISRLITPDGEVDFRHVLDDPRAAERMLMLKIAVLCNDAVVENPDDELAAWRVLGDPTDAALLTSASAVGLRQWELLRLEPRAWSNPFTSEAKFQLTAHRQGQAGSLMLYVKGAPERVLGFCRRVERGGKAVPMDGGARRRIIQDVESYSRRGLRVLAFGYRAIAAHETPPYDAAGATFVGCIGLKDPLRPEAKAALELTRQAGIRLVLVTGDHHLTAAAILEDLGLPVRAGRSLEAAELDRLNDAQLRHRVADIDVFARVSPQHKLRIVRAWQARGEVVAMTGDGVNDAPALQAADIGLAFNAGTDVAKETADVVLLENNFSTIVHMIERGRMIMDNVRKTLLYLVSDSLTEAAVVTGAIFAGTPLPLLPVQILWVNLVNDGLPALALTAERGEVEIMRERPRRKDQPLLDRTMIRLLLTVGVMSTTVVLGLYGWLLSRTTDIAYIRTVVFTQVAVDSLVYVFSVRHFRHAVFSRQVAQNRYLLAAIAVSLLLQLLAIYHPALQLVFHTVPLGWAEWLLIGALAAVVLAALEITKRQLWPPARRPGHPRQATAQNA